LQGAHSTVRRVQDKTGQQLQQLGEGVRKGAEDARARAEVAFWDAGTKLKDFVGWFAPAQRRGDDFRPPPMPKW